jgi:hypothetical protein
VLDDGLLFTAKGGVSKNVEEDFLCR